MPLALAASLPQACLQKPVAQCLMVDLMKKICLFLLLVGKSGSLLDSTQEAWQLDQTLPRFYGLESCVISEVASRVCTRLHFSQCVKIGCG